MPRRLLLIRHAQAGKAPVDRDRPLTVQGARTATAIGAWLGRAGFPTGAVAVFELAATFADLAPGQGTLTAFEIPA